MSELKFERDLMYYEDDGGEKHCIVVKNIAGVRMAGDETNSVDVLMGSRWLGIYCEEDDQDKMYDELCKRIR